MADFALDVFRLEKSSTIFFAFFSKAKKMKPEKASLHGTQCRFIYFDAWRAKLASTKCASYGKAVLHNIAFFRWSSSTLFRYEAFAVRKYEAQASCAACIKRNYLINHQPVKPTGFFVFCSGEFFLFVSVWLCWLGDFFRKNWIFWGERIQSGHKMSVCLLYIIGG